MLQQRDRQTSVNAGRTDLPGSDQLNEFCELRASASVNTEHALLMHREVVQLQRNFVLGITTNHQHATLHAPPNHTVTPDDADDDDDDESMK